MKYHITETTSYSLATIEKAKSDTVTAYFSVDIHGEQTAKVKAVQILYTDALFSGAGSFDRAGFLNAINILGATVTAGISEGTVTVYVRASAASFKKVMTLVETMLLDPHFDKKELVRIKQTTINALLESKENSQAIAHEQLRNALYGMHDRRYTYDEDTLIAAIKTVTPRDLNALHKTVCGLVWNCSIAAGTQEISVAQKTIRKIKDKNQNIVGELAIHQQKPPHPSVILKNIPSRQNIDFSIGAPIPITLHHPDYIPLAFALAVLGKLGGFTGRLMSTVREEEGLTYGIYAKAETFYNEEQGYWRIMTFFAPDKAIQGLTSTFREVKKLYEKGITEDELTKFKQILHTGQALLHDSTARLLGDLHAYHLQKFSLEEIAEHKKRYASLTLDEVNNAIRTYLNPDLLTISGAGPINSVKKELQSFLQTVS